MTEPDEFKNRQIDIFFENCDRFADRVEAGQLRIVDAVDMLQSAAELAGLVAMIGDDAVQKIMSKAFTGRRAGA